jgi:hypothetical protein
MFKNVTKKIVKQSPLWPLLNPRRFHAYCIGIAKSGTVSAWGMFSTRYRSAHEANRKIVVDLMISRLNKQLPAQAAIRQLKQRDRELRLEMDSSNLLAMFAEELVEISPKALFLLTVREPRSWLKSIINQHLNIDVSNRPADKLLRQLLFTSPGLTYSRDEYELERLKLFPIDGYLSGWKTHYQKILDIIPKKRLLIVRTEELAKSIDQLASFLSISPDSIDNKCTHLHPCPHDHGVFERLPQNLVNEKVAIHTDELMSSIADRINKQLKFWS